jgi:predicted nucleic acid-binding protein
MIKDPRYIVTLCFQIEDGSKWGKPKPCNISLTENQLEMLYSALANWREYMERMRKYKEEEKAELERLEKIKQKNAGDSL